MLKTVLAVAFAASTPATLNLHGVPLGDGHVGSAPNVGWVDSCVTSFNPNAGGAQVDGPWIDEATKTWDYTAKVSVQGSVSWPQASYSTKLSGTSA